MKGFGVLSLFEEAFAEPKKAGRFFFHSKRSALENSVNKGWVRGLTAY